MLRRFGKFYEYDGPPEAKDIVHYARKATEPAVQVRWRRNRKRAKERDADRGGGGGRELKYLR